MNGARGQEIRDKKTEKSVSKACLCLWEREVSLAREGSREVPSCEPQTVSVSFLFNSSLIEVSEGLNLWSVLQDKYLSPAQCPRQE